MEMESSYEIEKEFVGKRSVAHFCWLGAFSIQLLAQDKHQGMMHVGKKGETKFNSPMRVGEIVLKPATCFFQHIVEGKDHVVIFKTASGEEAVRLKCRLEPLGQKARRTALYTHVGGGSEKILDAVAVRGEDVRHVI